MSTAAKPRTLDAALPSAGYHADAKRAPVDLAHLKRVVTLGMVLSRYGLLADLISPITLPDAGTWVA
jgi:hypothetical protein